MNLGGDMADVGYRSAAHGWPDSEPFFTSDSPVMQQPSQATPQPLPTSASPAPHPPAERPVHPRKRPLDGDQADDDAASETVRCEMQVMSDGSTEDWRALMQAETWYSAQEAVDAGLADSVAGAAPEADPENAFDLSIFQHAGRSKAPAPAAAAAPVPDLKATEERRLRLQQRRHAANEDRN